LTHLLLFRNKTSVHRSLQQWLVVALLTLAIGGHWAVLQSVAWTTMLAGNLRTSSLAVAVERTFDGQHPCKLCKVVSAGKKSEKQAEFPTLAKQLEFTLFAHPFVFSAPTQFYLQAEAGAQPDSTLRTPPVPPPRSILA
jgi:hypothetical protein